MQGRRMQLRLRQLVRLVFRRLLLTTSASALTISSQCFTGVPSKAYFP